jgi:nitroimidazol reductase NimA-like FMN-containing flavoprotein (pyridoxamine 5'-phosphate oxidase superfamily)
LALASADLGEQAGITHRSIDAEERTMNEQAPSEAATRQGMPDDPTSEAPVSDAPVAPVVPKSRLIPLDERECRDLLLLETVGRLAVTTPEGPEIFPVNYGLVDDAIIIGTDPGVKLAHSSFDHVAFEVDRLDYTTHTGWVVVAKGRAEDISDAIDPWSTRLRQFTVRSWIEAPHTHQVAIMHPRLSGRRLVPND